MITVVRKNNEKKIKSIIIDLSSKELNNISKGIIIEKLTSNEFTIFIGTGNLKEKIHSLGMKYHKVI